MSLYTCPDYAAIESQQDARRYSDMLDAAERLRQSINQRRAERQEAT